MKQLPERFQRYGRRLLPLAMLAMTALAAAWIFYKPEPEPEPEPVASVATEAPPPVAGVPANTATPAPGAESAVVEATRDIFAVQTWEPPAPVVEQTAAAPEPPPPPTAPPLPFRFVGKLLEPGKAPVFFLAREEQVIAVQPGQRIDAKYRVGQYRAGELQFIYLPMKVRQSLAIGSEP